MVCRAFMHICPTHRLCHERLVDNDQNSMLECDLCKERIADGADGVLPIVRAKRSLVARSLCPQVCAMSHMPFARAVIREDSQWI